MEKEPVSKTENINQEKKAEHQAQTLEESADAETERAAKSARPQPRSLWPVAAILWLAWQSLRSTHWPTRRMALLFFISSFGVLISMSAMLHYMMGSAEKMPPMDQQARTRMEIAEMLRSKALGAKSYSGMTNLGVYSFAVNVRANEPKINGVDNLAQLEIVAQCDHRSTCIFLEEHLIQVQNEITQGFISLTRSELLTKEGKLLLKQSILQRLNQFLPRGKVENIYFSQFVIT